MALLLTTFQLSLAEHVHEVDACQGALSCLTGLEPEYRASDAFDRAMVLLHTGGNGRPMGLVVAPDG
jgi:hypothetical protein